jgi:hypothetical protein
MTRPWLSAIALFFTISLTSQSCVSIDDLEVPGAEVLNISSVLQTNVSGPVVPPWGGYNGISFCDVTVVLTHPGGNDTVTVEVWLPTTGWNGRFQVRSTDFDGPSYLSKDKLLTLGKGNWRGWILERNWTF